MKDSNQNQDLSKNIVISNIPTSLYFEGIVKLSDEEKEKLLSIGKIHDEMEDNYQSKYVVTGFLNHSINLIKCIEFFIQHPKLKDVLLRFKPRLENKKEYGKQYIAFLKEKRTLNLADYGFIPEETSSPTFGSKIFYKSPVKGFNWSELFEAVHKKLI